MDETSFQFSIPYLVTTHTNLSTDLLLFSGDAVNWGNTSF